MKSKVLKYFIIGTFVSLYLAVSIISTIHVIEFFDLSNPKWLSISLAIAFELGAAASLASLIALDKMNKFLVWALFVTLTLMQAMGNTYYAYTNIEDFSKWSELFGLIEEDVIFQKRILSIVSGAILPLVALGFIKSLVDYIKPDPDFEDLENISENFKDESTEEEIVAEIYEASESMDSIKKEGQEKNGDQEDSPPVTEIQNVNSNRIDRVIDSGYPVNLR